MFGVYVASGGTVDAIPKGIKPGDSFGTMNQVEVPDRNESTEANSSSYDARKRFQENLQNDPKKVPVIDYSEGMNSPKAGEVSKKRVTPVAVEKDNPEEENLEEEEEDGFGALERRLKRKF